MESRLAPEADGIVYFLPRSLMKLSVSTRKGEGNKLIGASFGFVHQPVADLTHRYVLNYTSNPLFHDRLCVMLGSDGYLSSIEYATEDATPRILVALAELAARAAGGPSAAIDTSSVASVDNFDIVFDPYDPRSVESANQEVNARLGLRGANAYHFEFPGLARSPRQSCDGRGVCFRAKIKTVVSVSRGRNVVGLDSVDIITDQVGSLDLSRAFLVEKVVRLGFDGNGALTELVMKKPSEALQAAKLPLDILDVLLAVPSNFVNNITGSTAARSAYVQELASRTSALESINGNLAKIATRTASGGPSVQNENSLFKIKCDGQKIKP